jgi:hypothetical protein
MERNTQKERNKWTYKERETEKQKNLLRKRVGGQRKNGIHFEVEEEDRERQIEMKEREKERERKKRE